MTTRDRLVGCAQKEVGSNDRARYCVEALGSDPGPKKAWCGMFFEAMLHEVGLALNHHWGIDGSGLQKLKLRQLEPHERPKPGDLGYQHLPFQHHFMVEEVGSETYTSIDGNSGVPGVQRHHRAFKTTGVTFYSIDPLLRVADTDPAPAPPVLRMGSRGPDVVDLQNLLNAQGSHLIVDGRLGPETATAVMSFQRRHGLDADGVVGPKTWGALHDRP